MTTPTDIAARLGRALGDCHRDEGGAVVMMGIAVCLILFMIALVLYDAGEVGRDKIDAQMAADTAAYSQAAVQARAMNHIAFANVAKRTTVGIRNAYLGGYRAYRRWTGEKCSECSELNLRACIICWTNDMVLDIEKIEFEIFRIMRLAGDTMTDYLETLDDYQQQMKEYAPYWGASEAVVRGVRNGANYIGTYPMPDTDRYGPLPVEKASGLTAHREACLGPTPGLNPITPNTGLEFRANIEHLVDESSKLPFPENITDVPEPMMYGAAVEACLQWHFLSADAEPATPMHLSAAGSSGEELMARGNFVFGFRQTNAFDGKLREKFDFFGDDYSQKRNYTTPGGGMWSIARAEVYFPDSRKPTALTEGPNGIWMFHPGWVGKMRPVALPGEELPVEPSRMWREARGTFTSLAPLFGVDRGNLVSSRRYMTKVMHGFSGKIRGKEVLDGTPK